MDILKERKEKLKRDEIEDIRLKKLRENICKKITLNNDIRLEIFDKLYGTDLIEKGEVILGRSDEIQTIEIYKTMNCFPFTNVSATDFVTAFKPLGYKKWSNICDVWSFGRKITDYGDLLRIESLYLNEEESKKIIDIGSKKYNCKTKIENRQLLFGGKVEAIILYLDE